MVKTSKIAKVVLGGTVVGATIYFGAQAGLDDYISEKLTTDAGEAAREYVTQLKEEPTLDKYITDIEIGTEYSLSVLPDSSKSKLALSATSKLEDSLKEDFNYKSMSQMPDSLKAKTISKIIDDMEPEYQNKIFKKALKKEFDNSKETVGKESKNLYESVKKFFSNLF